MSHLCSTETETQLASTPTARASSRFRIQAPALEPSRSERPGRRAHLEGPDGAMDRRVCLPHAATAAFEVQYTPAYAVIIAALTGPMTTMTVHAPPTFAPGLGSPRTHPHRKLLHRVFKFRLRRISPETRTAAAPPGGTKALGQAFGCTGAKRHYRSPPKSSHDSWPEKITETKTAIKQLAAPLRSTRRSFLD